MSLNEHSRILSGLLLAVVLAVPTPGHAQKPDAALSAATSSRPRIDHYDYFAQVGYTYGFGAGFGMPNHSAPTMAGLRFTERNGFLGRSIANAIYLISASASVSDREYLGSTYHYGYGYSYQVDHYRMRSQAEMDAQYQAIEETSQELMGSAHDGFDLVFYHPALGSDGTGFSTRFYFTGSRQFKDGVQRPLVFRFGLGGGYVSGAFGDLEYEGDVVPTDPASVNDRWRWWSISTPLQLFYNPSDFIWFDLEWDLNWAGLVYLINGGYEERSTTPGHDRYGQIRYAPISLSTTINPVNFLYLRATGTIGSFTGDGLGWTAEAGVRF